MNGRCSHAKVCVAHIAASELCTLLIQACMYCTALRLHCPASVERGADMSRSVFALLVAVTVVQVPYLLQSFAPSHFYAPLPPPSPLSPIILSQCIMQRLLWARRVL